MRNDLLKKFLSEVGFNIITIVDASKYISPGGYESMKEYYSKLMDDNPIEEFIDGSIAVVAMPYKHEGASGLPMSMGSLSYDYHRLFKDKISHLDEKQIGKFIAFADTGPLFDRTIASISGLGFRGKNECIINKDIGSYFYIGYILLKNKFEELNLNIDYDCGSCDRCIKACPTGAISGVEFKAELCLSHLTQKKHIDEKYYKYIKTLYGCDICQRVCPYNKYTPLGLGEFKIDEIMDYDRLFLISKKEYDKLFGNKAFYWKSRSIIKRNAILRAMNIGDSSIESYLLEEKKKDNDYINYFIDYYFKHKISKFWVKLT